VVKHRIELPLSLAECRLRVLSPTGAPLRRVNLRIEVPEVIAPMRRYGTDVTNTVFVLPRNTPIAITAAAKGYRPVTLHETIGSRQDGPILFELRFVD
jgi:hypothetical protein